MCWLRSWRNEKVLGGPVVSMMQSTESIVRDNAPGVSGTNPPRRSSLP